MLFVRTHDGSSVHESYTTDSSVVDAGIATTKYYRLIFNNANGDEATLYQYGSESDRTNETNVEDTIVCCAAGSSTIHSSFYTNNDLAYVTVQSRADKVSTSGKTLVLIVFDPRSVL